MKDKIVQFDLNCGTSYRVKVGAVLVNGICGPYRLIKTNGIPVSKDSPLYESMASGMFNFDSSFRRMTVLKRKSI